MCRQTTGSLVANFITVPVAQVHWHPGSKSGIDPATKLPKSLRKYESSPGHFRSFCSTCGSSIHWHHQNEGEELESLEMLTGSIDDGSLEAATWKARSLPTGGNPWLKNPIKGVTDATPGGKGETFTEGSASGTTATHA
ncbi:hypothetical protein BDV98DRAFT_570690 [Pterulicium gracile]|uniref:CENP-V/GFA domain-containing protein n=1 Tax=Pterulicium gracile TaxID=1884261 RepID=A0A5C3QDR8_9AGAR|nr:hypothetical protein BDV98DRAFT_570690 [Pterula gracilis]